MKVFTHQNFEETPKKKMKLEREKNIEGGTCNDVAQKNRMGFHISSDTL